MGHAGISSMTLHRYNSMYGAYISPTIIEERQLNVASMDVFSRLMMDRIIFLGVPIDDTVANIIQAQLLFLESTDPSKDIQIYFNSPGGSVYAGLGIYDTMQYITANVATICTVITSYSIHYTKLYEAQALNILSIFNPNISHEIIDGGINKEEVEKLGIQAVPTVMAEGKVLHVGRSSLGELLGT